MEAINVLRQDGNRICGMKATALLSYDDRIRDVQTNRPMSRQSGGLMLRGPRH